MRISVLWIIPLTAMLMACEPPPEPPVPETPSTDTAQWQPALEPHVEAALQDLASRLETDVSALEVLSAESVTWRDGALGCPEPGGMYTQALQPGYRIRISDGEQIHHYHGARDRESFYCPPERAGKPLPDSSDTR